MKDNEILKNIFQSNKNDLHIIVINTSGLSCGDLLFVEGKRIIVTIYYNDKAVYLHSCGTLNQIKEFHKGIKELLKLDNYDLIGNGIIYPGEIKVKQNDERTFSERGIRNNFSCKLKVKHLKHI